MKTLFCLPTPLLFRKAVSTTVLMAFGLSIIASPTGAQILPNLPPVGQSIWLTPVFEPPILRGMTVHAENPLLFDFIVDRGQDNIDNAALKEESLKLIKYFLASMTIPDKDAWVNLSPYEKDRIIPDALGQTEMGRQMLEQDYILKQLSASLTNPDKDLGQKFWNEVKTRAQKQFGTTEISLNTFNKVWIVPDGATVVEKDGFAYITESRLNVMLDEDYHLSSQVSSKGTALDDKGTVPDLSSDVRKLSTQVFREMILPKLIEEINTGKNFAQTRQVYQSVILAAWYKKTMKDSLLGRIYADKAKIAGVENQDKDIKRKVYDQYLEAFKKGAYNIIKEEMTGDEAIPRKYFSGGLQLEMFLNLDQLKIERASSALQRVSDVISKLGKKIASLTLLLKESPREENPNESESSPFGSPLPPRHAVSLAIQLAKAVQEISSEKPADVKKYTLTAYFTEYKEKYKVKNAQGNAEISDPYKILLLWTYGFDNQNNPFPVTESELVAYIGKVLLSTMGLNLPQNGGMFDLSAIRSDPELAFLEATIRRTMPQSQGAFKSLDELDSALNVLDEKYAIGDILSPPKVVPRASARKALMKIGIASLVAVGTMAAMPAEGKTGKPGTPLLTGPITSIEIPQSDIPKLNSTDPNFILPADVQKLKQELTGYSQQNSQKQDITYISNLFKLITEAQKSIEEKSGQAGPLYDQLTNIIYGAMYLIINDLKLHLNNIEKALNADEENISRVQIEYNEISLKFAKLKQALSDTPAPLLSDIGATLPRNKIDRAVSVLEAYRDSVGKTLKSYPLVQEYNEDIKNLKRILQVAVDDAYAGKIAQAKKKLTLFQAEFSKVKNKNTKNFQSVPLSIELFNKDTGGSFDPLSNLNFLMETGVEAAQIVEFKEDELYVYSLVNRATKISEDERTKLNDILRRMENNSSNTNNKDLKIAYKNLKEIIELLVKSEKRSSENGSQSSYGGIDFNSSNLNLQIKRDGRGVPLPLPQQNWETINIPGLYPVIINILPVNPQTVPILGQIDSLPNVTLSKS